MVGTKKSKKKQQKKAAYLLKKLLQTIMPQPHANYLVFDSSFSVASSQKYFIG